MRQGRIWPSAVIEGKYLRCPAQEVVIQVFLYQEKHMNIENQVDCGIVSPVISHNAVSLMFNSSDAVFSEIFPFCT